MPKQPKEYQKEYESASHIHLVWIVFVNYYFNRTSCFSLSFVVRSNVKQIIVQLNVKNESCQTETIVRQVKLLMIYVAVMCIIYICI